VDMLGVEYNNNIVKFELQDPVQMKIFNVFFRKDAPFNYNSTSNNGWLEVFIWGKINFFLYLFQDSYIDATPKSFNKTISYSTNSNKNSYFDEFVIPQIELDSTYKNFKALSIEIQNDKGFSFKIDDQPENKETLYERHLLIERYMRNNKHVSVPIATFTPI
jgi:hypothetical protein